MSPQPTVRVYSKPNCMQCRLTEKWLTDHAVPFVHDSAEADGVADAARSLGVTAAPIVVVGDEVWGGFRPDLLEQLRDRQGVGDLPFHLRRSR
ncbi:NrdH-redoxin [Curtobacterium sp. C1]|uniref:glutaredoxin domain-containing protein n=1 Tax=Curtobacterium sp. C1 TaxID=2898151 RepID=UPI001E61648C|nr:glutaredoxin domain-containing protein [Curtobacterium sp. C1]UFU14627.1 NrdH-redoxin [Curtobacterium sp. C1]